MVSQEILIIGTHIVQTVGIGTYGFTNQLFDKKILSTGQLAQ